MTDENTTEAGTENSAETTETSTASTTETTSSTTEQEQAQPLDLAQTGDKLEGEGETQEGEGDKPEDPTAAFYGAPAEGETYAIEGLPEGTVLDEEALKTIEPALRELNLSSAGASKLITTYAETVLPRVTEQVAALLENDAAAARKTWETEARQAIAGKDAEGNEIKLTSGTGDALSFDGLSEAKVMQTSARALDRIAPAGFREFLQQTGLGNHPQMIAFTYQAGKLLAEDTDSGGNGGNTGRPKTREEKFYGSK